MNDAELIDYVAQGGRLTAPGNVYTTTSELDALTEAIFKMAKS